MVHSVLEQYRISDLLEWHERKQLRLNPYFQRRNVWSDPARSFLIDTVLRKLPMPKIFMRTKVDLVSKQSYREVVDGQQRLRAIIDFSHGDFALNKRAGEFAGLKYTNLAEAAQETFLSYPIAVDQLINASDNDVLEVFARLNSYNVQLNPPELRHANFQGDFKWSVHETARHWNILWEKFEIISVKQRLRMMDDSLMAEMFGVLLDGVKDGGQPNITKMYRRHDSEFPQREEIEQEMDSILRYVTTELADILLGSPFSNAPHFLMLFAAVAHALRGIPPGDMGTASPDRSGQPLTNLSIAKENLIFLAQIIEGTEPPIEMLEFWRASTSTTHRVKSRKVRFPAIYRALEPGILH